MKTMISKSDLKKHMLPLAIVTMFAVAFLLVCYVKVFIGRPLDLWFGMCVAIVTSILILIYALYYMMFMRKLEFYKCYFVVSIVFGIIFIFMFPPYSTPDELNHIWSAYCVSNEMLGYGDPTVEHATLLVRECELNAEVNGELSPYLSRDAYNNTLANVFKIENEAGNEIVNSYQLYSTPHMLYVIPAIGITIGRMFSWGVVPAALLATLLNKLFFVFASTYAIKKIPFGKMIIAGVCLLPITLQQTSSVSYDNPLLTAYIVVIALGIRWAFTESDIKKSELIFYGICSIFLIAGKSGVYAAYCLMPFIYKYSREKIFEIWKKYKKQIVIGFAIVMGIWLVSKGIDYISAMSLPPVEPSEPTAVELEAAKYENYIYWAGAEGYSIKYLLTHPVELLYILVNTIIIKMDFYISTLYGQTLGWFQVGLPWFVILLYAFIGLVSAFSLDGDRFLSVKDKSFMAIFSIISCGLCAAAMLLYWTPKGYGYIEGLQGRYFLPPYMACLFCLGGNSVRFRKNIEKELLFLNVLLSAIMVFCLLRLF